MYFLPADTTPSALTWMTRTFLRYKLTKGVKITSTLNGQWNETQNYESLDWLKDHGFRELLKSYFNAMILESHFSQDGCRPEISGGLKQYKKNVASEILNLSHILEADIRLSYLTYIPEEASFYLAKEIGTVVHTDEVVLVDSLMKLIPTVSSIFLGATLKKKHINIKERSGLRGMKEAFLIHVSSLYKKTIFLVKSSSAFLVLRGIYQVRVFRITTNLQGIFTTNLQGKLYNDFTRKVLQDILNSVTHKVKTSMLPKEG
ncbi:hypothetical protein YC2023_014388 [Brassica napus]